VDAIKLIELSFFLQISDRLPNLQQKSQTNQGAKARFGKPMGPEAMLLTATIM